MSDEAQLEGFDAEAHDAEVRERWGNSSAFRESQRRTRGYGAQQCEAIGAEMQDIGSRFAALMTRGVPAEDARSMDVAEAHRRHISRWFYKCSHEMHGNLGQMYVADARFAARWDAHAEGMASYVRDAVVANAGRGR